MRPLPTHHLARRASTSVARLYSLPGPSSLPYTTTLSSLSSSSSSSSRISTRSLFSLLKPKKQSTLFPKPSIPFLTQDTLFHPLSQSPFEDLREKAARVKDVSICPVSAEKYGERVRPAFDCPDCGWPTHKNRERWQEGKEEHEEYCGRLREWNEDEHDIRSGRRIRELEDLPKEQQYDTAVNFANWDAMFFTRSFASIDSLRAVRHVSRLLTYPLTVAAVLHQNGPFTRRSGRLTGEGRRSMAALHSVLHLPPGSNESRASFTPQPPIRIFVLGARAESTLPPQLWQQLQYLFPRMNFNIYNIGPEVGLPTLSKQDPRKTRGYEFSDKGGWGYPAYTLHMSPFVSITNILAAYEDIHDQLGPFDPYTDIFFSFSPGLGFPHQPGLDRNRKPQAETGEEKDFTRVIAEPLVQAQTTWKAALQKMLQTKCPIFFTAFSPLDLQRDVSALYGTNPPSFRSQKVPEFPAYVGLPTAPIDPIEGVTDEFELVLTPGKNPFGSEKWEIAEWDVRVAVKANWGVWGIRGKKYEVVHGEEED
ncbi:putative nuclear encoded protein required for translation of COX1 mRNA [Naematelia encephala]|uniref:Putative nuclear encoded protein required for translation of COX1 mRNA n=1 Tax=Naematelia encephala TaxID=71784 RepID=A0A1Y2AIL3_9TREE|nr:putative nuclear encoded protein required for translation of COX1 mRNA [Naematelia encephala]